ncbi:MAG: pre-peptidase C-terminal domain-containing protein, partial [Lachnospiraceae bacterium]|nr:pre-peptidase C-terminal domain-containing protein [Lachnospiraceae bacterium]
MIDAAGNTLILDYTNRTVISDAMIAADHVRNNEMVVSIKHDQALGTYKLATNATKIGQGDPKGVYNWDTNTWDFKGEAIGDMDGIIEIRDENGILLANCTVNGDTEYFGRYNYTVRVNDNGDMYLDVGWNTREGRTYAADGYDNLTLATATILPENGTKYTIDSATDVDWFAFTLETPGRSSSYIGIDFKQWAGDLDLYLYDADGNQLDYAKSVTDNERISLRGLAAGDYYVKVEGYEDNVNEYKLAYKLPEPVVLTDAYENGDTKAHSYHLGKLSEQITLKAAISRTDDQDYYKFHLPKKGLTCDTITLTYDEDFGDLDLYLYGSNGKDEMLLAQSLSTSGGTERISLAGLKHGEYYVAVKAKDGSVGNYQLAFDVNTHEVNPDKLENNDTLKNATSLYTLNENQSLTGLSIHQNESKNDKDVDPDVDYYKFSLLEKGSADDWIGISYEVSLGDLDLVVLNADGEVVAYSRTAENEDTVSLKGFEVGDYYIRVSGYNNVANNYTLNWNVTNSSLIPSDSYEGMEPIAIRENQTITGLSIAKPVKEDETRADTFKIVLEYDAWNRSKIILTDYRSDWEDGMQYVIRDGEGNVVEGFEGTGSEISLYGLTAGEYYLTVDAPNEDEYSEYSLIAQSLPDSNDPIDNTWSFFIYLAGDNNLEGAYLTELLNMQRAILPENVEVYVLLDRHEGYSTAQRDWTDTRVGKIRHSNGGAVAVEWMYFDGVNTDTYMNTQNLELQKEWNTGDIATLEAFLDWGMKVGRADNYALIMKDHGSSLGYNCEDDTDGSILAIDEIAELLKADKYKKLSVVAFDQCLMGSDVVVSTMEGTVDYVVASEAIGWTPNLLVMYKVLLNSLETEMTPQEVSQKIVAACNCSGLVKLTLTSFSTSGHALSEALQAFGEAAKGFTREDWVAICKTFATAYNYGDEFWAYSDLGSFLSTLKDYSTSISGTLMEATETLYDVVLNHVVDSTMITPTVYGSGLAVFNPVLSNDVISFYATEIGQTAWGDFLYTAGQIAEDCTEFFVDTRANLTFTDFSYSIEDEAVQVTYNLGTFTGNGVEYNGLYMDKKACFTVSLDSTGIEGDAIRVVADNPEAHLTITLIQTEWTMMGPIKTTRRTSTDGVLSLYGIDPAKAGVDTEYDLIITSDKETTYSLSFVAEWTSGSDYFDYSRSGSLGAQGNGSIDKATKLAAGNYGGLVTYAGDPDFYQLNSVYSDTLSVTVNGNGLTVQEYDADGVFVQVAEYADGKYTITVANGNYLRVEGDAALAPNTNQVNSYSLYISDVSSTYLSLGGTEIQLPERPDVSGELKNNEVTVTVNMEDGMIGYQSSDLHNWSLCENDSFIATDNGLYYFKAVDPETNLESKYASLRVVGIDLVPPTISNVAANITTVTNTDVIVTAEFADDVALASSLYKIGENGNWLDYVDGVTVKENSTVYFKAVDVAGNESEIASYEVKNIDKVAPDAPAAVADVTAPTNSDVFVTAAFSDDSAFGEYSLDGETWSVYDGPVKFEANGIVYFRSTDEVGNVSDVTPFEVANIDKIPPEAPAASADVTTPTNQAVSVSATFSDDSAKQEYSLDGETWNDYTGAVSLEANGTVYFRGTDAVGNLSDVTPFEVTNIDTTAPEKPTFTVDVTTPTNAAVTVTAEFSADSVRKEYSLDGQTWQDYIGAITFAENGAVSFRGTDEAGNVSELASWTVDNIDKVKPVLSLTGDTTTPLQAGTLTATVDDGSDIYYSTDNATWTKYTGQIAVTANATYFFKATDAAGNTGTAEITFANIDTAAPVITLTGDNATPLQASTLTAAVDDGSALFYRIGDSGEWMEYTGTLEVKANAAYSFRATDAAGNTGTAGIAFGNIDTTAPTVSDVKADVTAPTNQNVVVTATFADNVAVAASLYRIGETGEWLDYDTENGVTVKNNATVYFKAVDAAGNESEIASYEVTNIDKIAPDAPAAVADVTAPTNGAVTVTAAFSDDSVAKEYSLDGQNWLAYTEAVAFTDNGTVFFRGTDAAGNVSA